MSDKSNDRPKCDSLADAVWEVKFWCGVNMLRFTYDPEKLIKLFRACCDFESGGEGGAMSVDYTIPKDEVRAGQFEIDGDVFVRVVRCRDCKEYRKSDCTCHSWQWHYWECALEVDPDGFCAWGEKRVQE